MKVQKFKRGQIWWYKTGDNYNGSIQGKTRPVVIMSNELANENSNCLLAIPCTTAEKKNMPTHTSFMLDGTLSTALAENMMSVNKDKLTNYIGTADDELLKKLEINISIALGLIEIPNKQIKENNDTEVKKLEIQPLQIQTNASNPNSIIKIKLEDKKSNKSKSKMSAEDKRRFLNDYDNHDSNYMIKKYGLKNLKALQQKVYMIRKEFGIRIRNVGVN